MSQKQLKTELPVEPIEQLIVELQESRDFYETAVQNAQQSKLKSMFEQRVQQRSSFITTLETQLKQQGHSEAADEERPQVSLEESIQRGLMTVKAAMTIERDETDETLLQECQEAEKQLLDAYKEILAEHDWPTRIEAVLRRQYEQVQAAHAYIGSSYARPDWAIVLGLFRETAVKEQALAALKEAGFTDKEIGVVNKGDEKTIMTESLRKDVQDTTRETAGAGALGGGAVGSIIGLTAGVSVALVTGPLLPILGITAIGAGIGATYGGIFGSLIGMGIGEEDVQRYLEGIRRGETMVAVKASPDRAAEAAGILRQHNGRSVMTRHDSFGEEIFDD
ncbi:MAG: PA2169 family four-helix-bundle protein [Chloroflexota bacterium]|jgi:uncharacterized protein (TIGR02284 family)